MSTYKDSGVDIELGDQCSALAYAAAKATFPGRQGMIGQPVTDDGGFAGLLDMGDYYLVQNDDGVGTKMLVAEAVNHYDTLGYDLLAMVVDDAVCIGAETISVSNTLDVDHLQAAKVASLMNGLKQAALEHHVVIPGGEIAEVGNSVSSYVWNATAVGIVEKNKVITGQQVAVGDKIIALGSAGFRSNGFSLVRHILKQQFGDDWATQSYDSNLNWGQAVLTPSRIFCSAVLEMHGRFRQPAKVNLKGVVHVTGGGIVGNLKRVLKKSGLGAKIDNLPQPHQPMKKLIQMGNVALEEAYRTWNMGVGMILISNDLPQIEEIAAKHQIPVQQIGEVTAGEIQLHFPQF